MGYNLAIESATNRMLLLTAVRASKRYPMHFAALSIVQATRFDPGIQIHRPSYVLALKRANSQEEALRLAKELQKDVPTVQAVKTDQGFLVDSLTPPLGG